MHYMFSWSRQTKTFVWRWKILGAHGFFFFYVDIQLALFLTIPFLFFPRNTLCVRDAEAYFSQLSFPLFRVSKNFIGGPVVAWA